MADIAVLIMAFWFTCSNRLSDCFALQSFDQVVDYNNLETRRVQQVQYLRFYHTAILHLWYNN
jgi:hypothetical protein